MRSRCGGHATDKVQTIISTDVMISATATRLPVPGFCNSARLWIEHAGAYSGAIEFSTGSFWPMETLSLCKLWLIDGSRSVDALASRRL